MTNSSVLAQFRIGVPPPPARVPPFVPKQRFAVPFAPGPFYVRAGSHLRIISAASQADFFDVSGLFVGLDGTEIPISGVHAPLTDRGISASNVGGTFLTSGHITGLLIASRNAVERGRAYAAIYEANAANRLLAPLAKGYIFSGHELPLGEFVEPGPGGGEGRLFSETIAANVAGNINTTYTPATVNTRRKIYGFVWYYNRDGTAATVTMNWSLRSPWGALPTGFAGGLTAAINGFDGAVLTANQEGNVFAYASPGGPPINSFNTEGSITFISTATNGIGFPLEVREDDVVVLVLRTTNGVAGDRYSAYALVEEWIAPRVLA